MKRFNDKIKRNAKPAKSLFALILFLFCSIYPTVAFSQKVDLVFPKGFGKKTVQIEFCDSLGSANVSANAFLRSDKVFFFVKPSAGQTWKFSAKDIETKVKELKINQNGKLVSTLKTQSIGDGTEDFVAVIIAYPKGEIDITKPFKIRQKEVDSEDILIPEAVWPNYDLYTSLLRKARNEYALQFYLKSAFSLTNLWSKDNFSPYLHAFSFYKGAIDSLNHVTELLTPYVSKLLRKEFDALKAGNEDFQIATIRSMASQYSTDIQRIDSFFNARGAEFDVKAKSATLALTKQTVTTELAKADEYYIKKNLSIFENGNYQEYRFKIYVELLAKLMTSVEKISPITSFDSIPVSQIKNYKGLYKEMADMSWEGHFNTVCKIINGNIKRDKAILNDAAIANLVNNKTKEPQPYASLFKGFNSLIKKDKTGFQTAITQSLSTITDKELLLNIDLYIALMNSSTTKDESFWEYIQKGYEAQGNGTPQEAKTYYEKAEKICNTNEVLFLLMAQTSLKLNDRYSAEIYFKRANTINPKFILPKLYQIDFLTEDKDYETALTYANEALATNPYWYFYYMKAQLLQLTGKFEDAKSIITNNCITINALNYEEYLLLGDVYSSLGDLKNARENYMNAGNIKPNDPAYKKKMEALKLVQPKPTK